MPFKFSATPLVECSTFLQRLLSCIDPTVLFELAAGRRVSPPIGSKLNLIADIKQIISEIK